MRRLLALCAVFILLSAGMAAFLLSPGARPPAAVDLLLRKADAASGLRFRAGRGETGVRYAGRPSLQNTSLTDRRLGAYLTRNGLFLRPGASLRYTHRGMGNVRFVAESEPRDPGRPLRIRVAGRSFPSGSRIRVPLSPGQTVRIDAPSGGWLYNPAFVPVCIRPRIILHVVIDAMRRDALLAGGGHPAVAPALNRLARESSFFAEAHTPSNWTRPATTAFFTGLYPWQTRIPTTVYGLSDADRRAYRRTAPPTLQSALRRHGWNTVGVVNNIFMIGTTPLGLDFGFNTIHDIRKDGPDTDWITRKTLRILDSPPDRPLYLFLNFNAPHAPYEPPARYLRPLPRTWPDHYRRYMGEVAFSDAALGRVLDRLRALGLYDEALIVVHSDHGEILDTRHSRAAFFPYMLRYTHGETAYREEIRVPLLVKYPKSRPEYGRKTVKRLFSLAALPALIYRTVRAGGTSPFPGEDSFRDRRGFLYFEGRCLEAVTDGKTVYSRRFPGYDRVQHRLWGSRYPVPEELYDLSRDPEERTNIFRIRRDRVRMMRRILEEHPLRLRYGRLRVRTTLPGSYRIEVRLDPGVTPVLRPQSGGRDTVRSNRLVARFTTREAETAGFAFYPPRFQGRIVVFRNGKRQRLLGGGFALPLLPPSGRIRGRSDIRLVGPLVQTNTRAPVVWFEGLDAGTFTGTRRRVSGEMRDMLKSWGYIQ